MPMKESWEWDILYYSGTVLLKMTPRVFWKSTPRKLNVLIKAHLEINSTSDDTTKKKNPKQGYIDQVL